MLDASARTGFLARPLPLWQAISLALTLVLGVDLLVASLFGVVENLPTDLTIAQTLLEGSELVQNFKYYLVSQVVTLAGLGLFLKLTGRGLPALDLRSFKVGRTVLWVLISGATLYVLTGLLLVLISTLFPGFNPEEEQVNIFKEAANNSELLLSFIALVVLAPISEEIIFRNILFSSMRKVMGVLAAAVVSSLLFGIVHVQLNAVLVTFVLGLLLCLVYYKTESLVPAILLHSLKNAIAFFLIFEVL